MDGREREEEKSPGPAQEAYSNNHMYAISPYSNSTDISTVSPLSVPSSPQYLPSLPFDNPTTSNSHNKNSSMISDSIPRLNGIKAVSVWRHLGELTRQEIIKSTSTELSANSNTTENSKHHHISSSLCNDSTSYHNHKRRSLTTSPQRDDEFEHRKTSRKSLIENSEAKRLLNIDYEWNPEDFEAESQPCDCTESVNCRCSTGKLLHTGINTRREQTIITKAPRMQSRRLTLAQRKSNGRFLPPIIRSPNRLLSSDESDGESSNGSDNSSVGERELSSQFPARPELSVLAQQRAHLVAIRRLTPATYNSCTSNNNTIHPANTIISSTPIEESSGNFSLNKPPLHHRHDSPLGINHQAKIASPVPIINNELSSSPLIPAFSFLSLHHNNSSTIQSPVAYVATPINQSESTTPLSSIHHLIHSPLSPFTISSPDSSVTPSTSSSTVWFDRRPSNSVNSSTSDSPGHLRRFSNSFSSTQPSASPSPIPSGQSHWVLSPTQTNDYSNNISPLQISSPLISYTPTANQKNSNNSPLSIISASHKRSSRHPNSSINRANPV